MKRQCKRDLFLAALTTSLIVAPATAAERAGETKRSQQNAYQVETFSPDTLEVGDFFAIEERGLVRATYTGHTA